MKEIYINTGTLATGVNRDAIRQAENALEIFAKVRASGWQVSRILQLEVSDHEWNRLTTCATSEYIAKVRNLIYAHDLREIRLQCEAEERGAFLEAA